MKQMMAECRWAIVGGSLADDIGFSTVLMHVDIFSTIINMICSICAFALCSVVVGVIFIY